ncbi:hypothetical protein OE88DRAFT_1666520 [Heliocybe sulcata]|uniref:Fungal-type protein kinase domain-containing protein n=1 Tax=Heliocybe sulcata TaxID=5364 RepID=A0A5C3MQN8_9AGAM|nr:hypothetical protein OE88DRAFT_1666520 [Heliocybe sulcata]
MATMEIFAYLMNTQIFKFISRETREGTNTRSSSGAWGANKIRIDNIGHWDLTIQEITTASFAYLLKRQVEPKQLTNSKQYVYDERSTEARLESVFWLHVRRALNAGFSARVPRGHVRIICDVGSTARFIQGTKPDRAARVSDAVPIQDRPNRLPGDIKVSWKWYADMVKENPDEPTVRKEYFQVVSQLLYYMKRRERSRSSCRIPSR